MALPLGVSTRTKERALTIQEPQDGGERGAPQRTDRARVAQRPAARKPVVLLHAAHNEPAKHHQPGNGKKHNEQHEEERAHGLVHLHRRVRARGSNVVLGIRVAFANGQENIANVVQNEHERADAVLLTQPRTCQKKDCVEVVKHVHVKVGAPSILGPAEEREQLQG